jgi:hypothetical protein
MLPLCAVHLRDLGPGDRVQIVASSASIRVCSRRIFCLRLGLDRHDKVLDPQRQMRCRGCGVRGRASSRSGGRQRERQIKPRYPAAAASASSWVSHRRKHTHSGGSLGSAASEGSPNLFDIEFSVALDDADIADFRAVIVEHVYRDPRPTLFSELPAAFIIPPSRGYRNRPENF